jgi:hypothetical protein
MSAREYLPHKRAALQSVRALTAHWAPLLQDTAGGAHAPSLADSCAAKEVTRRNSRSYPRGGIRNGRSYPRGGSARRPSASSRCRRSRAGCSACSLLRRTARSPHTGSATSSCVGERRVRVWRAHPRIPTPTYARTRAHTLTHAHTLAQTRARARERERESERASERERAN